jgi:hypothetical protein
VLIPIEAAAKAHLPTQGLERRLLELKGKAQATDELVLRVSAATTAGTGES